jgi:HEAT repeat protein
VYVKVNEAIWSDWTGESGWPDSVPPSVLFDPLSTVSATYGVALQTKFRDDNNVWSSEPAIFVIDAEGVVRHVESHGGEDIREDRIFPIVDDLHEQRRLITALSANKDARGGAARIVLARVGARTKTVIPVLIEALKDEAAPVRAGAAAGLYWIAEEAGAAVPALAGALQDPDSRVRRLSGLALARIGPGARAAVPALIQVLGDEDARVRAAAISALGRIGPDAAAGLVEALQKDKAARIRAAAAAALPTIPDRAPAAVPALIAAMKDADAGVRAAAAQALKKIDPQAAKKAGVK